MDLKSTLRLPKTDFPMRGDLAKREPAQPRPCADSIMTITSVSPVSARSAARPRNVSKAATFRRAALAPR